MQVSVETVGSLGRCLTIEVPCEKIYSQVDMRLKEMSKTANIKGFRPGKVPMKVLKKRYGQSARQEVLSGVLQSSLSEAVLKENLKPAATPRVEIKTFEEGKPLQFTATFEVCPKIDLVGLKDVEVEQLTSEVTESDIDNLLERIRKQYTAWEEVDRSAQEKDQVIIDFEGFVDDKAFENGKAEKTPLILGSNVMIPGFEAGIIGAKASDEISVNVKFPEEYHSKEMAGKDAVFKIKVYTVSQPVLPELDDAFAKKCGVKEGGIKELRDDLRKKTELELKNILKIKNKNKVMDKLLELNKVELPQSLVDMEVDQLHRQVTEQYAKHTPTDKIPEISKDIFKDQAIRLVSLGLLIAEVVNEHDIKANLDKVRSTIGSLAAGYDHPEEIVKWYYSNQQHLAQVEMVDIEDQVVEKLLESAKIIEKKVDYDEAVRRNQ